MIASLTAQESPTETQDEPATASVDAQDRLQSPKQQAFLAAYANSGNVTRAAELSGVHRRSHYHWMKNNPAYEEAFQYANDDAVDLLAAEARRRAVEGVENPIFHNGKKVGAVRDYSDTLLIFLLKAARPEVYRDNHHQHRHEHRHQATSVNSPKSLIEMMERYRDELRHEKLDEAGAEPHDREGSLVGSN